MKSFKQYISEVQRYEYDGDWAEMIPELLYDLGVGPAGPIFAFPETLGDSTIPVKLPWTNPNIPPWHITHPNNGFNNPPPGWSRQGDEWQFTPMPTGGGNYVWNPSNGTWKEIVGPPSPYGDPNYIPYTPGSYPEIPDDFSPSYQPGDIDWEQIPKDPFNPQPPYNPYRDPLNPLYSPPSYWEAAPPGGTPPVGPNYFPPGQDPAVSPIQTK